MNDCKYCSSEEFVVMGKDLTGNLSLEMNGKGLLRARDVGSVTIKLKRCPNCGRAFDTTGTPKNSCVSCISYIERVCPRVPMNHEACTQYNDKLYYEACLGLIISQESDFG